MNSYEHQLFQEPGTNNGNKSVTVTALHPFNNNNNVVAVDVNRSTSPSGTRTPKTPRTPTSAGGPAALKVSHKNEVQTSKTNGENPTKKGMLAQAQSSSSSKGKQPPPQKSKKHKNNNA